MELLVSGYGEVSNEVHSEVGMECVVANVGGSLSNLSEGLGRRIWSRWESEGL